MPNEGRVQFTLTIEDAELVGFALAEISDVGEDTPDVMERANRADELAFRLGRLTRRAKRRAAE